MVSDCAIVEHWWEYDLSVFEPFRAEMVNIGIGARSLGVRFPDGILGWDSGGKEIGRAPITRGHLIDRNFLLSTTTLNMSVQQIRSLLAVPDFQASNRKTTEWLNESVPELQALEQLETLLQQAEIHHRDLQTRVRQLLTSSCPSLMWYLC